jgi:hypothetical protein
LERVFQQEAAKSPDEAVQTAVPLLEIASSMPPPIPAERQRLQDLYLSVDRAFSQIALDPVALASRFNARGAASRLKLAFSDKPPRECALVGPDGGVSLPGEPTPDLQSTYFAISFRCPRAKAPDRSGYSKAGWPNESVAPADVGSTASGMRIAALIGENAKYEKVLLPKRQTAPRNEQDPSQLSLDSAIQFAR